jgi:hypothetical protein
MAKASPHETETASDGHVGLSGVLWRLRQWIDLQRVSRQPCTRRGYRSRDQALDAADAWMARGEVTPGCHLTPYRCRGCRQWHLYQRRIVRV